MSKKFWKINNQVDDEPAELMIYGAIANETWFGDEVTPKQFADDIRAIGGKDITVRINSCGGDVFAAQAIYNQLRAYSGTVNVVIDGICASAATIIASAGKTITMPSNAVYMIHNPSVGVCAHLDVKDLEALARELDTVKQTIVNVYMNRVSGALTERQLSNMMDKETWLLAEEAKGYGFVDVVENIVDMENVGNSLARVHSFYNSADLSKLIKAKKEAQSMNNDILAKIKNLLIKDDQNEPDNQSDPVIIERECMIALDNLSDGSEIVNAMLAIAKKNGSTASDIEDYVNVVKEYVPKIAADKGMQQFNALVQDQQSSGANSVAASTIDSANPDSAIKQAEAQNFNDVVRHMNMLKGVK